MFSTLNKSERPRLLAILYSHGNPGAARRESGAFCFLEGIWRTRQTSLTEPGKELENSLLFHWCPSVAAALSGFGNAIAAEPMPSRRIKPNPAEAVRALLGVQDIENARDQSDTTQDLRPLTREKHVYIAA